MARLAPALMLGGALSMAPLAAQPEALRNLPAPAPAPSVSASALPTALVDEALQIANDDARARPVAVRTAAALLPRLAAQSPRGRNRQELTQRWATLARTPQISTQERLSASAAFFDAAAAFDPDWAFEWALNTPEPSARAGALLAISRAVGERDWARADEMLALSARAARAEGDPVRRARALTFVAYRATELSPARAESSIREASSAVGAVRATAARDNLYAELTGAAARFDLALARDMAGRISDERLRGLAAARANIAEISQTTLTTRSSERVQSLAIATAPFDNRALPFLVQLEGSEDVSRAISEALPPIFVTARPAISVAQLEELWEYSQGAPAGVYRDQLQSRLARLMVLQDLWRGRAWGQQLAWQGGRVQVGAFLRDVLQHRRSRLQAAPLQDVALADPAAAITQARQLRAPAERAEALLLIAGQLLES